MKCKYCGQEMIDIKDYCVNCGKKLKEDKKGISLGGLFLIFGIIVAITVAVCYGIMHFGTDKELKPYLKYNENTNENVDTKVDDEKNQITHKIEYSNNCGEIYDAYGNVINKTQKGIQEDGTYIYIIAMGEKSTGGYSIEVSNITYDSNNIATINYTTISPLPTDTVTQAFTCPKAIITFNTKPTDILENKIENINES